MGTVREVQLSIGDLELHVIQNWWVFVSQEFFSFLEAAFQLITTAMSSKMTLCKAGGCELRFWMGPLKQLQTVQDRTGVPAVIRTRWRSPSSVRETSRRLDAGKASRVWIEKSRLVSGVSPAILPDGFSLLPTGESPDQEKVQWNISFWEEINKWALTVRKNYGNLINNKKSLDNRCPKFEFNNFNNELSYIPCSLSE